MNYYVEIRKIGTDEVIKRMGPHPERQAERIERGALVNINHEQFYTEIVPDDNSALGDCETCDGYVLNASEAPYCPSCARERQKAVK